ncbi:TetR/AcrR family transcriptional regulator [Jannaschia seohaensis]|uniref:AcrR family transcriptional regulator n=1 Tax=Jannaschia seohaensis TaxID=475081 RepID=A0A2Y9A9M1_9RHOB|nr:TetR/AcrR family transcriptional regulator [Jannaschia seohaensis]PWJ20801.1 AcrR family transcriptional regulator [Jannaschia seohaensis]SSA41211.1 DNA-binding transcriptional regulator, AcrR family [Jannaschia seohaensis]
MPDKNKDVEGRSSGRPRSERSKAAILVAVRGLLLKDGYANLTIEAVARRAGVSKATIYRWWKTKGELVLEAADQEIAIGTVPDTGDSRDDMETAIGQLLDTFTRPLASIVIFAAITTGGSDPKMAQIFRDRYVYPWRVSAFEALERAQARGDVSAEDLHFLLDVIVGTVFQRTLVMKEPMIEGLKENLLGVIFGPGKAP